MHEDAVEAEHNGGLLGGDGGGGVPLAGDGGQLGPAGGVPSHAGQLSSV